jgi:hypothetical protein
MRRKDLLFYGSGGNYDPPMTDSELWKAVGRVLSDKRTALGHSQKNVGRAIQRQRQRALNVGTVRDIENGEPKSLGALSEYCAGLGMQLSDVLASVLPTARASPDAMEIAKLYDAVMQAPQVAEDQKTILRKMLKPTLQVALGSAKQGGDGPVAPAKKPGRSARER